MKYFDLHSDTLYEAFRKNCSPFSGKELMAPLSENGGDCRRVLAIWSDNALDDDSAYRQFFKILEHYRSALPERAAPSDCLLAVEDARLLANDLDRLRVLYESGVRLITLTWKGVSCIGGAWDTDEGLTPFGRETVKQALALGIAIDLSHASDKTFAEALALCQKAGMPPVASHSNSRALCPHRRNLTDGMFRAVTSAGGIVGISFVPHHLSADGNASLDTVLSHILHFLSLGGEDSLAIGSDFDGVSSLPHGMKGLSSLTLLAEKLEKATSREIAEKILVKNACRYFEKLSL